MFTGVSGSGKSSLAFGTLYAEAQRRYLESVAPYARRLIDQMGVPEVDAIDGLPPAVALQQQRGAPTTRSSVGSVTTLSNLLRMLYSRAGDYPPRAADALRGGLLAEHAARAPVPTCHGLGRVYDVTEASMVPDDSLTIRERAIAAWPPAWHGQNLRDILVTLGYDVDMPVARAAEEGPRLDPLHRRAAACRSTRASRRRDAPRAQAQGGAELHGHLHQRAALRAAHASPPRRARLMKKRVARYMVSGDVPAVPRQAAEPRGPVGHLRRARHRRDRRGCRSKRLRRRRSLRAPPRARTPRAAPASSQREHPEKAARRRERIAAGPRARASRCCSTSGSATSRSTAARRRSRPASCSGCGSRRRCAPNLFGVVYVLDEPSAGLHPADTEALLRALDRLKASGNSLFVVEHDLDVIRHADWIVDVGPGGGRARRRGALQRPAGGLGAVKASQTRRYLFDDAAPPRRAAARADGLAAAARRHAATTCTVSTSTSRSACSPRSPAFPARASPAW